MNPDFTHLSRKKANKRRKVVQTPDFVNYHHVHYDVAHANPENPEQTRRMGKWMDECHIVFQRCCWILGSRGTPESNLLGATRCGRDFGYRPLRTLLVVSDAPSSYQRGERQAQCGESRFHSLPRLSEFLWFETGEQMRTTDKADRFSRFPNLFHL